MSKTSSSLKKKKEKVRQLKNPIEKAKVIVEKLLSTVSDIDIILLYGAFAQGRGHSRSDYDMIAISDSNKVKWEFVIDNRPICLWSMTWKDVEDVITGINGELWSIGASSLVETVIVYYKEKSILDKFNNLKKRVREGGENALKQAIANFDSIYGQLWRIQEHIKENNLLELTFLKWDFIASINCILSALNNRYFLNNWGKQFQEINKFEILPEAYISRTKRFIKSEPKIALELASELVEDVRILLKLSLKSDKNEVNIQKVASEWPGVIEYLNKSKSAEEKNDLFAGLYAACDNAEAFLWGFNLLQKETWKRNSLSSVKEGLSNISEITSFHIKQLLTSQNLTDLRHSTEQLVEEFSREVVSRGLILPIADSLNDGKKFIQVKIL